MLSNTKEREFEESVRRNVPLAAMTTLGVGGPARYFAEVTSTASLIAGLEWARWQGLPLFVLGGGSNIVVADSGFPGLVLCLVIRGIEIRIEGEAVFISVGTSENWDSLVSLCVENDWAGNECLSGIPGSVGATPIQNIGAYGQEASDTLVSLRAIDVRSREVVEMSAIDCEFSYHVSRFNTRDRNHFIITSVTYQLTVNGSPTVVYPDVKRFFLEQGISEPRLSEVRAAVLSIRRRKGMVLDPNDPDSRSLGSFFTNPTITREQLERIERHARDRSWKKVPAFDRSDGFVKVAAAWLVEHAGFERGFVRGNVGLSTKHCLAIINRGGACAREIIDLAGEITSRVHDVFGVTLQPEPVYVGFDQHP